MAKYRVTGGLGRLCQFPKTVEVEAQNREKAFWKAYRSIKELMIQEDFKGDENSPMLSKLIGIESIKELEELGEEHA